LRLFRKFKIYWINSIQVNKISSRKSATNKFTGQRQWTTGQLAQYRTSDSKFITSASGHQRWYSIWFGWNLSTNLECNNIQKPMTMMHIIINQTFLHFFIKSSPIWWRMFTLCVINLHWTGNRHLKKVDNVKWYS